MGDKIRRDSNGHRWRQARARAIRRAGPTPLCAICHRTIDKTLPWPHPDSISVDHITPVSKGGHRTAPDNLRCVHLHCNQVRGNRDTLDVLDTLDPELRACRLDPWPQGRQFAHPGTTQCPHCLRYHRHHRPDADLDHWLRRYEDETHHTTADPWGVPPNPPKNGASSA